MTRPEDGPVDAEQLPVDLAVGHLVCLQVAQNAVPQAASNPGAEPVLDGLPRAEAFGEVVPAAAVGQDVQDGIDHELVILPLTTAFVAVGREELALQPRFVGKAVGR